MQVALLCYLFPIHFRTSLKRVGKIKRTEILYKTAECYRGIGDNKQAEVFYAKAIKGKYADPICQLKLADSVKANGRYNDAIIEYDKKGYSCYSTSKGGLFKVKN